MSYSFKPRDGRVLNEYQLVYITKGSGTFAYEGHEITVQAGTMLFLFPGVRHHYCPDPRTGWDEYWVGFNGEYIDAWVRKGFFQVDEPVAHIGLSATIVGLYEEILKFASEEKTGFQILVSGIVTHLLGTVYYKKKNSAFTSYLTDKINEARILMRDHVESPLTPEEIASRLGLGYSWFRRMFKEYTGLSPARYQSRLRLARAKELLASSSLSVSEIAFRLSFENAGQFSTFFKNNEGITPTDFRMMGRQ